MSLRYFCTSHSEAIQTNEPEAWRCWAALMQRGIKAYTECRVDAAYIYLGAALDVALIRNDCGNNKSFCETHAIKPAEFILQLFLIDNDFNRARILLHRISVNCEKNGITQAGLYDTFFAKQYQAVEIAEKAFMEGKNFICVAAPEKQKREPVGTLH